MSTDPDTILLEAEESMTKAVDYLTGELKGIRTGRASPSIVEHVKVEAYGAMTDLKSLAVISIPEPSQILIKPFDAGTVHAIKHGIEQADLGLNPQVEAKQIRINVPSLSSERRQQLVSQAKRVGEEQKVAIRNARRDANKAADGLAKATDAHYPEDDIKQLKDEIQELLKKYEGKIDKLVEDKVEDLTTL